MTRATGPGAGASQAATSNAAPSPQQLVAPEQDVFAALRAARADARPMVVAQLGQSLDGRIATATGHSHFINGAAAIHFLHRLRAHVDAVVVGAGTAAADDPQLTVRHVEGPDPARVLIDRTRRCGADLRMLAPSPVARYVVGPPLDGDPDGLIYLLADACSPEADISPGAVLDALADEGLTRVLIEGGATTVSRFIATGAVERLCVLVAPMLIGSGPAGLDLPEIATLTDALRPPTRIEVLDTGDVVFDCQLR